MHPSGKNGSDQDPKESREKSKLGCQYRAKEGPGCGNCREVVAEKNVFVRWLVIVIIPHGFRGCFSLGIKFKHLVRYPKTIEPVSESKDTECNNNEDY